MKLYELSTQYAQLVDMLQSADEEMQVAITDTLDAIADSIEVKAESIAKMMQQIKAEKDVIDAEIDRLSERSSKLKKQAESLKQYLQDNMLRIGADKIKTPLFSFTMRNNAPSVNIVDESLIPQEYIKLTPSIDKRAILERLKANETVEGCALQQTRSLMIK
jgi:hypothetical protein